MLHVLCGAAYSNAPCIVNGKCSKHYSKRFCKVTTINEHGFVAYRHNNDPTKTVTINGFMSNNFCIVPYH